MKSGDKVGPTNRNLSFRNFLKQERNIIYMVMRTANHPQTERGFVEKLKTNDVPSTTVPETFKIEALKNVDENKRDFTNFWIKSRN